MTNFSVYLKQPLIAVVRGSGRWSELENAQKKATVTFRGSLCISGGYTNNIVQRPPIDKELEASKKRSVIGLRFNFLFPTDPASFVTKFLIRRFLFLVPFATYTDWWKMTIFIGRYYGVERALLYLLQVLQ